MRNGTHIIPLGLAQQSIDVAFIFMNEWIHKSTANDAWSDEWEWTRDRMYEWSTQESNQLKTLQRNSRRERERVNSSQRLEAVDISWTTTSVRSSIHCVWCYLWMTSRPSFIANLFHISFTWNSRLDLQETRVFSINLIIENDNWSDSFIHLLSMSGSMRPKADLIVVYIL